MVKKTKKVMTQDEFVALQKEMQYRPINTMETKTIYVNCKDGLSVDWDLQPRTETNGDDLIDSISSIGLKTSIECWQPEGQKLPQLLCGHRRLDAIIKMSATDYKRIFPKGIPCKVYTDITEKESIRIRADHGIDRLKQPLTTKVEALRLVMPLFRAGYGERCVIGLTFDAVCPILSKQYHSLKTEIANITDAKEKLDVLMRSQKGNYQFLRRISESPNILRKFWIDGQQGEAPQLSRQKDYEELAMVYSEEVKADALSAKPIGYNRNKPGREFMQAFNDAKKTNIKGEKTKETVKILGRKKLEDILTNSQSNFAKLCFKIALGMPRGAFEDTDALIAVVEQAYKKNEVIDFLVEKLSQEVISKKDSESIEKILS